MSEALEYKLSNERDRLLNALDDGNYDALASMGSRLPSLFVDRSISSISFYRYLRSEFGAPNCEAEGNVDWIWFLGCDNAYLEISGYNKSGVQISVWLKPEAKVDFDGFSEQVENDLIEKVKKFKKRNNSVSKTGEIVENPYKTYLETSEGLYNLALASWQDYSSRKKSHIAPLCRSGLNSYLSCFESFLNLLYFLFLKKGLTKTRLQEGANRLHIDLKIRMAPIYCSCFETEEFDEKNPTFKRYMQLVDLRNDFVHANFRKEMIGNICSFDNKEFITFESQNSKSGLKSNFRAVLFDDLKAAREIVFDMINLLLSLMNESDKERMKSLMDDSFIRVTKSDKGIEFEGSPHSYGDN